MPSFEKGAMLETMVEWLVERERDLLLEAEFSPTWRFGILTVRPPPRGEFRILGHMNGGLSGLPMCPVCSLCSTVCTSYVTGSRP